LKGILFSGYLFYFRENFVTTMKQGIVFNACFSFLYQLKLLAQQITTRFEQSSEAKSRPLTLKLADWWKKLDEKSGKVKMLDHGYDGCRLSAASHCCFQ
jgi:hypothetical protein